MNDPIVPAAILDDRHAISELDKSNCLGSIDALADQVKHAWEESKKVTFSPSEPIANVVVTGMGGSGLGADLIRHLFKDKLTVPFEVVNGYQSTNALR